MQTNVPLILSMHTDCSKTTATFNQWKSSRYNYCAVPHSSVLLDLDFYFSFRITFYGTTTIRRTWQKRLGNPTWHKHIVGRSAPVRIVRRCNFLLEQQILRPSYRSTTGGMLETEYNFLIWPWGETEESDRFISDKWSKTLNCWLRNSRLA